MILIQIDSNEVMKFNASLFIYIHINSSTLRIMNKKLGCLLLFELEINKNELYES